MYVYIFIFIVYNYARGGKGASIIYGKERKTYGNIRRTQASYYKICKQDL